MALNAFNTQLLNLISNMKELYPEDKDITTSEVSINLLKKTNPKKIVELFNIYVMPYKELINKEDEQFFLENDFVKTCNINNDNSYNIMNNFKKYWKDLDSESKQNIWKYFKVLIILSEKI